MHLFKNNQAAMLSLFDCILTYFPLPILIKKGEILPWYNRVPQKFTIYLLDSIKYLNFQSDSTVDWTFTNYLYLLLLQKYMQYGGRSFNHDGKIVG